MTINRRDLLASAAALGAASSLPLSAADPAPASAEKVVRNGRIKQSACSWCFTGRAEKWSLDKLCGHAKALGCSSVELLGAGDFATVKRHGLTCAIASNGMGFQRGFNNPRHRDELVAKTKAAIDACAEAGFPSVIGFVGMKWTIPNDPKSPEIARDDAFRHCVDGLKAVVGHAEKQKVTICVEHLNSKAGTDPMHGHPGYQGDDLDWVVAILEAVGSPRAKLLFDIYHVQIMHGDLVRRIGRLKELIGHVHTAGNPGRCELDDNQEIAYPAVMRKLAEIAYAGFVGHEFIPTRDPLDGLRQAVRVCDV